MSDPAQTLLAAQAEALAARQRVSATVGDLQRRLDPQAVVQNAKQAGIDTVTRHPGAVAGAVATVGLFLARGRIARLFRKS